MRSVRESLLTFDRFFDPVPVVAVGVAGVVDRLLQLLLRLLIPRRDRSERDPDRGKPQPEFLRPADVALESVSEVPREGSDLLERATQPRQAASQLRHRLMRSVGL